jgi:hypothetical protein
MSAASLTPVYTVHTPGSADYEVWTAPDRPGQAIRRAVVTFPQSARPDTARVDFYRGHDMTKTGERNAIPLQAARFMARCHVEWPHPDDAGSCVVFASSH